MGTSESPKAFAAKISAAGAGLAKGVEQGVRRASLTSKATLNTKAIGRMTGGDMRLSGAKNRKVNLRYKVSGSGERTRSEFNVTGPIMLVEGPTVAHKITPKGKGRRKADRRKAIAVGPGTYRASANHPGTRGKHLFKKVRDGEVPRVAAREIFESTAKATLEVFK